MVELWCDGDGNPLKDKTGKILDPFKIRGELNPGAINPENAFWEGMRIDSYAVESFLSPYTPRVLVNAFNKSVFRSETAQQDRHRLGVLSAYGDDLRSFNEVFVESVILAEVGEQEDIEYKWGRRQKRAKKMNAKEHKYDLRFNNCHTMTAAINEDSPSPKQKRLLERRLV